MLTSVLSAKGVVPLMTGAATVSGWLLLLLPVPLLLLSFPVWDPESPPDPPPLQGSEAAASLTMACIGTEVSPVLESTKKYLKNTFGAPALTAPLAAS